MAMHDNIRTRHLHCLLDLPGSLSSFGGPFIERDCVKSMLQTEEGFKQKILDMEQFWQFPRCWTAINGYHIPMECSPGGLQACKEYHHFPLLFYVRIFAFYDEYWSKIMKLVGKDIWKIMQR